MSQPPAIRVALTGDVSLEIMAPYFRAAGYEVYVPPGFGTWRQEILDEKSALHAFKPDFVFDVTAQDEALAREIPDFFDARWGTLAAMPYSLAGIRAIVEEFAFFRLSAPKKILAVDADNTLWRGILSEDGKAALEPYTAFQQGLVALSAAGVILVLLTKNDPADCFMREDMILKDADFAVRKINWGPKAGNLLEACGELNLGVESVVFVDDNPYERAQMAAHLPDVTVVPFPEDMARPQQFLRRLKTYFFASAGTTREDRLRTASYRALAGAARWRETATSLDEYLTGLGLQVSPTEATDADLERLAQMAGKTNQFNATTRRRDKAGFAALLADRDKRVFVFRTRDRFGEQGLVCYIVVDVPARRITDFVMSCRAMGRTLEHFAMRHVCETLGFEPSIEYVPTPKNAPFKAFLDAGATGKTYYARVD